LADERRGEKLNSGDGSDAPISLIKAAIFLNSKYSKSDRERPVQRENIHRSVIKKYKTM